MPPSGIGGITSPPRPAFTKEEVEQPARPTSAASEPVNVNNRPTLSRGSSGTSQPPQESKSPKRDVRRQSAARAVTHDVQRPRAARRGMSDPTQPHQSLERKASIGQASVLSKPKGHQPSFSTPSH